MRSPPHEASSNGTGGFIPSLLASLGPEGKPAPCTNPTRPR